MLRDEFNEITQDVAAKQTNGHTDGEMNGQTNMDIEHFRQRYLALAKVVQLIDDVMGLYNLMMFAVTIPAVCISIYCLLRAETDMALRSVMIYSLFTVLFFLAAIIWAGTSLNQSVS